MQKSLFKQRRKRGKITNKKTVVERKEPRSEKKTERVELSPPLDTKRIMENVVPSSPGHYWTWTSWKRPHDDQLNRRQDWIYRQTGEQLLTFKLDEGERNAREFLVKRRAPSGVRRGGGKSSRSILIAPLPFIKFRRAGQFAVSLRTKSGDSFLASGNRVGDNWWENCRWIVDRDIGKEKSRCIYFETT